MTAPLCMLIKAFAAGKKYKILSTVFVFPQNSQITEIKFIFLCEICLG